MFSGGVDRGIEARVKDIREAGAVVLLIEPDHEVNDWRDVKPVPRA